MDQSELKYAIRVDEGAFFIRFYSWLWEADKSKINFCKLFWGYLFAAPALVLRGIIGLMRFALAILRFLGRSVLVVTRSMGRAVRKMKSTRPERYQMPHPRKRRIKKKPPKEVSGEKADPAMQRMLRGIEDRGTVTVMRSKAVASPIVARAKRGSVRVAQRAQYRTMRLASRVGAVVASPLFGRLLLVIALLLGIGAVAMFAIYVGPNAVSGVSQGAGYIGSGTGEAASAVVHSKVSFFALLGVLAMVVGGTIIWAMLIMGVPYLIVKWIIAPAARSALWAGETAADVTLAPAARAIDGGLKGFGQAMRIGFYAVKTSTCPRIELEKRPDYEKIERLEKEVEIKWSES
jgi:hypothetical protein